MQHQIAKIASKHPLNSVKVLALAIILATSANFAQASTDRASINSSPNSQVLLNQENASLDKILEQNKALVLKNGQERLVVSSKLFNFYKDDIHSKAKGVIDGLEKAGFEAYLVGGGVRDLLLGKDPHDFDVTTNATPEEVCKVFANAQIIGTHFKFAKVFFDDEDIEVATFRKSSTVIPNDSDDVKATPSGKIVLDNRFSKKIEDDALRRDLTINAVFFDLNKSELIDYHGGIYDLKHKIIDTVRDPELTFIQDPSRFLRSLRFVAKLDFTLSDRTAKAISSKIDVLNELSPKQMFSETHKFFNAGHSIQSYKILNKYHIFTHLFPDLKSKVATKDYDCFVNAALSAMDERYKQGYKDKSYVSFATLLWPKYHEEYLKLTKNSNKALNSSAKETLVNKAYENARAEQSKILTLPEDVAQSVKIMWSLQDDLLNIGSKDYMLEMVAKDEFVNAFELLKLRANFDESLKPYVVIYEPYYQQKLSENK